MIWNFIITLALNLVISYYMRPEGPADLPQPKLKDLDIPTAEEGKPIGVLFGRRHMTNPNVIWYGALRTTPIKKGGGKK